MSDLIHDNQFYNLKDYNRLYIFVMIDINASDVVVSIIVHICF